MEELKKCIVAGYFLKWLRDEWKEEGKRVFNTYPRQEWKIPFSEYALHVRAAGKKILAALCQYEDNEPTYCAVVYEEDGSCGQIMGPAHEVLPIEMRKLDRLYW